MKKRGMKVLIFLGLLILLIVPLISAGFFSDFWGRITGYAEQGTTTLNITIGNTAPTVSFVAAIAAVTPNENGVNYTAFIVNATDADGVSNLNDTTVEARFQLTGETTRLNTSCILLADIDANSANYSCTVGLYYFDNSSTSWTVNVTVDDINGARGENTSTSVQFNQLQAMVISPTALTWAEFGVTATNQGSNNDPILLNNTGNDIDLNITVNATNLQGETTATQFIFAANLTVGANSEGCGGTNTTMSNATAIDVNSAELQKGNNSLNDQNATSGQEQTFFCVTAVNSDLSAQSYSSAAYGAWTIATIT